MSLCVCPTPNRPTGREPEQLPPWECLTCGGYACEYAEEGQKKCPSSICDCFIDQFPDSPRDLHPEVFIVTPPIDGNLVRKAREKWEEDRRWYDLFRRGRKES